MKLEAGRLRLAASDVFAVEQGLVFQAVPHVPEQIPLQALLAQLARYQPFSRKKPTGSVAADTDARDRTPSASRLLRTGSLGGCPKGTTTGPR